MDVSQLLALGVEAVARAAVATIPVFVIVLTIASLGRSWLAPWSRQALWSLVLLRLLLPVSVGSPASLQPGAFRIMARALSLLEPTNPEQTVNMAPINRQAYGQYVPDPQTLPLPTPAAISQAPTFDWIEFAIATVLLGVLFGGMLLVASWTAITTLRLRRWVRSGTECQREEWLALLAEGQRRFEVTGTVALRTVPRLIGPATYGWWRPTILLPEDASTWTRTELRHVLWHELAHIRRCDVAANWVLALVRVVHWWNPMFWWAQRAWLAERELACDALALRQLESNDVREYGQTLLRFLERLATEGTGLPTIAPGFVLFWGRKREAQRRLAELAQLARPELTWRRWLAGGLIAALAVSSLTDAATLRDATPPNVPLDLPAGTTWSLIPLTEPDLDSPRTTRVYDLSETVERLRKDDPELTSHFAGLEVQQILQGVLQPSISEGSSSGEQLTVSNCVLQDHQLVVQATAVQHDEVQRFLSQWSQHGMRQVSIEIRFMTTWLSLKNLLPGVGGTVLNLGAVTDNHLPGGDFTAVRGWTQSSVPAFMQVLSPQEATALIDKLQADARSNLLLAPKITNYDGRLTSLLCGVERPFVTGLQTKKEGGCEPQISVVSEVCKS